MSSGMIIDGLPAKGATLDTETGGFDILTNPLLSIGLSYVENGKEMDAIELFFQPPQNTYLEVPIPAQQSPSFDPKQIDQIEYLYGIWGGDRIAPGEQPADCYIIRAQAAALNGFAPFSGEIWDTQQYTDWLGDYVSYAEGQRQLTEWLSTMSLRQIDAIAHNASFDKKFVDHWLPEFSDLITAWYCTQKMVRAKVASCKQRGYGLKDACKTLGYEDLSPDHSALVDARACAFLWEKLKNA